VTPVARDVVLLPLCVDTTDQHRRVVWEAGDNTGGRCKRWSALHAKGVTIRALPADQVASFEPYRPPKPLQERWMPVAPLGTYETVVVDPEDPQQPQELPRPRIRQLAP
jgi:hypothetical protein